MAMEEMKKRRREANRRYCLAHPDRVRESVRRWNLRNAEKQREKKRIWRKENLEKVRTLARRGGLKRVGFSVDVYDNFLRKQGSVCAICGLNNGKRRLCADHDHKTGAPRGLLCHSCNTGLGSFRDSVLNLEKAKVYLCPVQTH